VTGSAAKVKVKVKEKIEVSYSERDGAMIGICFLSVVMECV
jgi:hypothetical protein